jgi:hypothetical protein
MNPIARKKIIFYYLFITTCALLMRLLLLHNKDSWHDEWHTIYVSDPLIDFKSTLARYWGDKGDTFLTEFYLLFIFFY